MKRTTRLGAMISLAGFLLSVASAAQPGLRLKLRTDQQTFLPGEPVVVFVSLSNNSRAAIDVNPFLEPEYGAVSYSVASPEGKEVSFLPWALKEPETALETLPAGGKVERPAKIFFGANGWTFTQPGKYQVRAVYHKGVAADPVDITIVAPTGDAKKTADLLVGSEEAGKFLLLEGGDHLKEGLKRVEQVADELPNSPHAAYANVALAGNLMRDFANFGEGRLRKADPQKGLERAERAKGRLTSFYYLVRAYLLLAEGFEKTGNPGRAEDVRRELKELTSKRFRELAPFLNNELKALEAIPPPPKN